MWVLLLIQVLLAVNFLPVDLIFLKLYLINEILTIILAFLHRVVEMCKLMDVKM